MRGLGDNEEVMVEEISRENRLEKALQNTRDLVQRLYPMGNGKIKDSVGYVITACRSGNVTFDQLLELRKGLHNVISEGGPKVDTNTEVRDALLETSKLSFFFSGVVVGANEAAKLVAKKIENG